MKFLVFKDDEETDIFLNLAHITQIGVRRSRVTGNCYIRMSQANSKQFIESQHVDCQHIWTLWNEMIKQLKESTVSDLRKTQDELWLQQNAALMSIKSTLGDEAAPAAMENNKITPLPQDLNVPAQAQKTPNFVNKSDL